MIILSVGCASTKTVKIDNHWKHKYETKENDYNLLLYDFNTLVELEKECHELNKQFVESSKVNQDLLKEMNSEFKTIKKGQFITIIVISIAAGLLLGGTVAGVAVKYSK